MLGTLHLVGVINTSTRLLMTQRVVRAIILGPPGSGKGTISNRIVTDFAIKHLSTGDLLRKHVDDKTEVGEAAKKYLTAGRMVPDDVINGLMMTEIQQTNGDSWLLDGYPRTWKQADTLTSHLPVDTVVSLDVPFSTIVARVTKRWLHPRSGRIYHEDFNPPRKKGYDDFTGEPLMQRTDDLPETVRQRLEHYEKLTHPLRDYFRDHGLLTEFSGTSTNAIWPQVRKHLTSLLQPVKHTKYVSTS